MKIISMMSRELTLNQVLVFFLTSVIVFVCPLILADYFYIDDSWRSQVAGMAWKDSGRILTEWLYQGLSFTQADPNIFPLPLIIAAVVVSFSLRSLAVHFFPRPTIASCFVILPMWYSPYFLQNLSYQYDGPAMALGLAAIMYAISFRSRSVVAGMMVPGILIAVALSFYQMMINIYIGLCCVELIRSVNEQKGLGGSLLLVKEKVVQLLVGLVVYLLTAYQFMTSERKGLRAFDSNWDAKISTDLHLAATRVGLLYNEGNAWLLWSLLILASAGFLLIVYRLFRSDGTFKQKIMLSVLCFLTIPVLLVSIPGLALVFDSFNDGARLMVGLSTALVLIFYLSYHALTAMNSRLGVLLVVPVIAMLSFSYAYGRVMNAQKELGASVTQSLAYDMISNPALKNVMEFYVVNHSTGGWLAGADGSTKLMPALKYVLNVDFILLAEMMPRVGVTNISAMGENDFGLIVDEGKDKPLIDNKFYSVYVVDKGGYVLMKKISSDSVYRHK